MLVDDFGGDFLVEADDGVECFFDSVKIKEKEVMFFLRGGGGFFSRTLQKQGYLKVKITGNFYGHSYQNFLELLFFIILLALENWSRTWEAPIKKRSIF